MKWPQAYFSRFHQDVNGVEYFFEFVRFFYKVISPELFNSFDVL